MKKREITLVIVLILTFLQIFLLRYKDVEKKNEITECISEVKTVKNIKDIENELTLIKNLEIINYNKKEGSWIGRLIIEGSKDEVLEAFNNLKDYRINNYSIKYYENKLALELEVEKI
ncbi:hypothetical protein [Caproiciproducens sp. MSJ-32]|uniref:hypothetical protein n=1 Tax=Caproiciproducens sp. MSJ-32 TaxID=2841527 RepID=UPI001C112E05|nr:hypothetical protein [Caproiciproducens sp. MSJ-32]MBU5454587.1 hypothetical protein [Caproiciproducens sp. MSJ-32]